MTATPNECWLALVLAPKLSSRRLQGLLEVFGSVSAVVGASDATLRQAGLRPETLAALRDPEPEALSLGLQWLEADHHHLVGLGDARYPPLLARTPAPPPALFVAGDPDVLWRPQVAMVGSRNPTAAGLDHARDFAQAFTRMGFMVTSGMAAGIDAACHEAALNAGGATVSVNGTGLDTVYPRSSTALAERIEAHGARVSEFPPGTPARRGNFPARNRIISGLSLGVLVVEAGLNSGSLITARLAAEQGREVFALPGSLHNPLARGCHRLIKEGARLVESTEDVVTQLAPLAGELAGALNQALENDAPEPRITSDDEGWMEDPDYQKLWAALGHDPASIDALAARTGMAAGPLSSMLLLLELRGKVESRDGMWVAQHTA